MQVPGYIIDNKPTPFPEGVYVGAIQQAESRWNDANTRCNIIITFRDLTLYAGETEPGARPYRVRLPVVWDGTALVDIEDFKDSQVPYLLIRSTTLFTQLAIALGVVAREKEGDQPATFDMDEFLAILEEGGYNGEKIGIEVVHRAWTSKDGKRSGIDDGPSEFKSLDKLFNSDEDQEAAAEAVEETKEADEKPEPPKAKPRSLRRR